MLTASSISEACFDGAVVTLRSGRVYADSQHFMDYAIVLRLNAENRLSVVSCRLPPHLLSIIILPLSFRSDVTDLLPVVCKKRRSWCGVSFDMI